MRKKIMETSLSPDPTFSPNTTRMQILISKTLHHALKVEAMKNGITMNTLGVKIIREYLAKK